MKKVLVRGGVFQKTIHIQRAPSLTVLSILSDGSCYLETRQRYSSQNWSKVTAKCCAPVDLQIAGCLLQIDGCLKDTTLS